MSAQPSNLRRVAAIFAGLLFIVITSTAADALCHASGVFPPIGQPMPDGLFVLALAYRAAFSIAGAWLTASLLARRPMWHAMALGWIGVALSLVGTVTTWHRGPEFGPHWYPLLLTASALPCSWTGARIFLARQNQSTQGES